MARMKGAVAAKESDDKSRRIRRKALELARDGKLGGGGTRPFGFEDDRKTIRAERGRGRDRGGSSGSSLARAVRSICFDLNERGIKTVTGKAWAPQVLTRMLKSGRISGQREHRGEIVADAEWPGIIPSRTATAPAILSDPARRKNERARRYLLAGMLRCGRCGEPLISRPRDDGRRRYVCARRPDSDACGKMAVVADELEELIAETVLQRLEGPDLARALAAQNGDREDVHQREVDEANEQLEELARVYGEQQITASEWMAARGPIEERLAEREGGSRPEQRDQCGR